MSLVQHLFAAIAYIPKLDTRSVCARRRSRPYGVKVPEGRAGLPDRDRYSSGIAGRVATGSPRWSASAGAGKRKVGMLENDLSVDHVHAHNSVPDIAPLVAKSDGKRPLDASLWKLYIRQRGHRPVSSNFVLADERPQFGVVRHDFHGCFELLIARQ